MDCHAVRAESSWDLTLWTPQSALISVRSLPREAYVHPESVSAADGEQILCLRLPASGHPWAPTDDLNQRDSQLIVLFRPADTDYISCRPADEAKHQQQAIITYHWTLSGYRLHLCVELITGDYIYWTEQSTQIMIYY